MMQTVAACQGRPLLVAGARSSGVTLLGTAPRPRAAQRRARVAAAPPRAFKGGEAEQAPKQEQRQAPQPTSAVTFKVARHLAYGQVLKVVGGPAELGAWDVDAAPAMVWSEGDQWLLTLELPPGAALFKLVAAPAKAERGGALEWEPGPNRDLQVPQATAAATGHGAFTVVCEWSHTDASLQALPAEEPEQLPAGLAAAAAEQEPKGLAVPTDDEEEGAALRAEDLRAEPYSPNGDEGEAPVGVMGRTTVGKMELEPAAPTAADAPTPKVGTPPPEAGKPPAAAASAAPAPAASKPKAPAPAAAAKAAAGMEKLAEKARAVKKGSTGSAANGKAGKAGNGNGPTAAAAQKGAAGGGGGATAASDEQGAASASAAGGKGGGEEGGKEGGEAHAPVGLEAGDYPSQTPMGEGAGDALGGEPAGGLKPSTEAAVKEDLRKSAETAAPTKPGLFTRLMQALSGSKKQEEQKDDDDQQGPGPSGGSSASASASGGAKASGSGASRGSQQKRGEQPPPSASAAMAVDTPLPGWQVAAAAAGLAALPVVGWSEWVLKSTGCGLPPGPGGALGAVEGLSYLAVGGVVLWSLSRRLTTGRGLPAGPAGALGAVEGGSWALALAGAAVLAAQVQQYGYIPGALPDANCFGQPVVTVAAASGGAPAQLAAAPPLTDTSASSKAASLFSGPVRVRAGGASVLPAASLPQANLLFSVETLLSQSAAIAEGAETAAAAMAAAAVGQPPPAQVSAAVSKLQGRLLQAQQLVGMLQTRLVGLGGEAAADMAVEAAVAPAPEAAAASPARFQPPRHRVRAALAAGWDRVLHSQKLQALTRPIPLPAAARHASEVAPAPAAAPAAAATAEAGSSSSSGLALSRKQRAAAASPSGAGAGAAAVASQTQAPQDASRAIDGNMAAVFGGVLSDLGEGYAGLWEGATHFDPAAAAAYMRHKFATAQAHQAELAAKAAAAEQALQAQQQPPKQQQQQQQPAAKQPAAKQSEAAAAAHEAAAAAAAAAPQVAARP